MVRTDDEEVRCDQVFQIVTGAREKDSAPPVFGAVLRIDGYRFQLQRSTPRIQSPKRPTVSTLGPLRPYSFLLQSDKFTCRNSESLE